MILTFLIFSHLVFSSGEIIGEYLISTDNYRAKEFLTELHGDEIKRAGRHFYLYRFTPDPGIEKIIDRLKREGIEIKISPNYRYSIDPKKPATKAQP